MLLISGLIQMFDLLLQVNNARLDFEKSKKHHSLRGTKQPLDMVRM